MSSLLYGILATWPTFCNSLMGTLSAVLCFTPRPPLPVWWDLWGEPRLYRVQGIQKRYSQKLFLNELFCKTLKICDFKSVRLWFTFFLGARKIAARQVRLCSSAACGPSLGWSIVCGVTLLGPVMACGRASVWCCNLGSGAYISNPQVPQVSTSACV